MLHELFRARAATRPDATAVVHRGTITYRELDRLSDRIADGLAAAGIGPGAVVPVLLPPSISLVATLLAVLKRCAAYAALDSAWPSAQLRRVAALLPGQLAVIGPGVTTDVFHRTVTVAPDGAVTAVAGEPAPRLTDPAAMVFFTSGSTGVPKAVLVGHRAVSRLFTGATFARFDHTTVMAQAAALPWDAFALELWGPLVTGGVSVLLEERPSSPTGLRRVIAEHGVNTAFLTTSLFHLIVEEDIGAFAGLRTLLVGGEKLAAWHAGRLLAVHPDIHLVNGYGPVESTIFALTHDVRPADVAGDVPLGRPVPGTRVVLLRDGELGIAGDGLAIGYLGDPALTDDRFITSTVDGQAARIYRTGDLASVGPDGVFRFHGRLDRQVKVRGHRIEPAGVERVVAGLPGVSRCVVVPVTGPTGNCESLALFYRPDEDAVTETALTEALRTVLPAYSVPDRVIAVARFPLSANGKIDTAALLRQLVSPVRSASQSSDGSTLGIVTAEFAAVLGRPDVEPTASFFALGGTSLSAVRLCTRLGIRFGLPIPVSRLMRSATAASIAAWLSVPADPVSASVQALTPMQHSFLLQHLDAGADLANHCLLTWTITGPLRVDTLGDAVRAVHDRHTYLRGRYADEDTEAHVVDSGRPAEFVSLTADSPDAAVALRDAWLRRPFDLAAGQVWRAVLVRVGTADRWHFSVAVHHIAFDGWSQHLLADELSSACGVDRPPLPSQIVRELAELAAAADLPAQRAYWARELRDVPPLALPVPTAPDTGPTVVTSEVDAAEIDRTAHTHGTGRLAVLLSALADSIQPECDFAVGVPVTQRATPALTRPIGCLINMVAIRLRTGDLPTVAGSVADALANADLPFAEVVRSVRPPRTARHPIYQMIVAVQDSPPPTLSLPGCQIVRDRPLPAAPMAELLIELETTDGPTHLRITRDPQRVDATTMTELHARLSRRLATVEARP